MKKYEPNFIGKLLLTFDQYIDDRCQLKFIYLVIILGGCVSFLLLWMSLKGWVHYVFIKIWLVVILFWLFLLVTSHSGTRIRGSWFRINYGCGDRRSYFPAPGEAGWIRARMRALHACFLMPGLVFFGVTFVIVSLIIKYLADLAFF